MRLDRKHCKQHTRIYKGLDKDFDDLFDFLLFAFCIAFAAGCILLVAVCAYESYCAAA